MKILLPALLFLSLEAFAQDKTKPVAVYSLSYAAKDSIVTDKIGNTLRLYGDVDFTIDQLHIKAEQVDFDKKNETVTATGLKKYSFPYKRKESLGIKKGTLKYKLGSDTVFIN